MEDKVWTPTAALNGAPERTRPTIWVAPPCWQKPVTSWTVTRTLTLTRGFLMRVPSTGGRCLLPTGEDTHRQTSEAFWVTRAIRTSWTEVRLTGTRITRREMTWRVTACRRATSAAAGRGRTWAPPWRLRWKPRPTAAKRWAYPRIRACATWAGMTAGTCSDRDRPARNPRRSTLRWTRTSLRYWCVKCTGEPARERVVTGCVDRLVTLARHRQGVRVAQTAWWEARPVSWPDPDVSNHPGRTRSMRTCQVCLAWRPPVLLRLIRALAQTWARKRTVRGHSNESVGRWQQPQREASQTVHRRWKSIAQTRLADGNRTPTSERGCLAVVTVWTRCRRGVVRDRARWSIARSSLTRTPRTAANTTPPRPADTSPAAAARPATTPHKVLLTLTTSRLSTRPQDDRSAECPAPLRPRTGSKAAAAVPALSAMVRFTCAACRRRRAWSLSRPAPPVWSNKRALTASPAATSWPIKTTCQSAYRAQTASGRLSQSGNTPPARSQRTYPAPAPSPRSPALPRGHPPRPPVTARTPPRGLRTRWPWRPAWEVATRRVWTAGLHTGISRSPNSAPRTTKVRYECQQRVMNSVMTWYQIKEWLLFINLLFYTVSIIIEHRYETVLFI